MPDCASRAAPWQAGRTAAPVGASGPGAVSPPIITNLSHFRGTGEDCAKLFDISRDLRELTSVFGAPPTSCIA